MTEIKPHKILVAVKTEQIKNGDPDFIVSLLSGFEKDDADKIKSLRGGVSVMFPNIKEYNSAFLMWSMGLYTKYPNFAYFLNKESIDFVVDGMLYDIKSPPADKGKLSNNLYSKAVDFGIKYGYTKEEMSAYFSH
jgi:hypothetical protein